MALGIGRTQGSGDSRIEGSEGMKRWMEVVITLPLALVSLVPAAVVAFAVFLSMGSPVLFRHRRIGRHNRPFLLYKFRTMRQGAVGESDSSRMTPIGRTLRTLSLDELPQLWNVLRGDMALVGPRPLLPEYLARYTQEQARRHEVLPGITGLAQIEGRNSISWERKFELDCWYVDHRSTRLDLQILARTVAAVLTRAGVNAEGHATMPEFRGDARAETGSRAAAGVRPNAGGGSSR